MSISQTYQHLNAQERAVIMLSHGAGFSVRAIARTLARSPSTISRELRRMSGGPYDAVKAAQHYQRCRLLNGRPRQTLGWRTPEEVWTEELEKHAMKIKSGQKPQRVALEY